MKQMARAISLGVLVGVALTMSAPASAQGEAVIEKRIDLMKNRVLKNFAYAKDFVKEGKGTADGVADSAKRLNEASKEIVALFPEGTGRGNFDDKTTRALPKIWEDWDGFQAAAQRLTAESAKLAQVAETGDKDAIAAQFAALGKNGCGSCHKPYRGAKVK